METRRMQRQKPSARRAPEKQSDAVLNMASKGPKAFLSFFNAFLKEFLSFVYTCIGLNFVFSVDVVWEATTSGRIWILWQFSICSFTIGHLARKP